MGGTCGKRGALGEGWRGHPTAPPSPQDHRGVRGTARPALTWCMPAGHVAGSLPAGLAPCSPSRTLVMASPVAWAGKKQARMAPTPSCPCAQLTFRGPALKSSRMRGCPAAAGTRGVTTSPVPRQLHGMGHAWDPAAWCWVLFSCPASRTATSPRRAPPARTASCSSSSWWPGSSKSLRSFASVSTSIPAPEVKGNPLTPRVPPPGAAPVPSAPPFTCPQAHQHHVGSPHRLLHLCP